MSSVANNIFESSSSTGTGDFTLVGIDGRVRFSDATYGFGTGGTDVFWYLISNPDAAEWEIGTGHMSDANTLVRDTVLASSNSDSLVNFSAGTKSVTNDIIASEVVSRTELESIGAVNASWFGAVGDGVTDDTTAVQAAVDFCVANERALYVPGGTTYYLSDQITADGPFRIFGDGMSRSKLVWGSAATAEGIVVTLQGASSSLGPNNALSSCERVALLTEKQAVGTAITIDCSANISGGVIVDRTTPRARIRDVQIAGATNGQTDGWNGGIDLISCMASTVESIQSIGYQPTFGDPYISDFGLRVRGSGQPAKFVLSNSFLSSNINGIVVNDIEGVYVNATELVGHDIGVVVNHATSEPLFHFVNSHIAALEKCIELTNAADAKIIGNWLSPIGPQTGAFDGVDIRTGCSGTVVAHNTFVRPNVTSIFKGVRVTDGDDALIDGNMFETGSDSGCQAILISSLADRTRVTNSNRFVTNLTKITDSSSTSVLPGWELIANSGVAASHTGDTNETALATVSIPAQALGPNGAIKITALFSLTNNANSKLLKIRLGGIGGTQFYAPNVPNNASLMMQRIIQNRNSQASQVTFANATANTFTTTTGANSTGAVSTNSAQDLVITGQLTNAADSITLEMYQVEVIYRP